MTTSARVCLLVPHYEHIGAVADVIDGGLEAGLSVLVVDDGSANDTLQRLRDIVKTRAGVELLELGRNGGKGTALRAGYRHAAEAGYTHTLEMDADGQHASASIPDFLAAIASDPEALVLGAPQFDDSAPWIRLWGRQLSVGLVWAACRSRAVRDPLCGFRGVPLARAVALLAREHTGDRMNFDAEFAVRMVRDGASVINVPTPVHYPADGVSHFDMVGDNLRLTATYVRLLGELLLPGGGSPSTRDSGASE